jgi:hypothetical protein
MMTAKAAAMIVGSASGAGISFLLWATSDVEAIINTPGGGVNAAILAMCLAIISIVFAAGGIGLRLTYTNINMLTKGAADSQDKMLMLVSTTVQHCSDELRLAQEQRVDELTRAAMQRIEDQRMHERVIDKICQESANQRAENARDRESREKMVREIGKRTNERELAKKLPPIVKPEDSGILSEQLKKQHHHPPGDSGKDKQGDSIHG